MLTSLPEDAIASRFEEYGYAMVVADGMGASERARWRAGSPSPCSCTWSANFGKWNLRVDDAFAQDIMARVERFYRQIDSAVSSTSTGAGIPRRCRRR